MWRLVIISFLITFCVVESKAQVITDFEAAGALEGYNRISSPGEGMSEFNAGTELGSDPAFALRLRLGYRIACRHDIFFTYAPLQQRYSGTFDESFSLNGNVFQANTGTALTYTLNNYRATYRYFFLLGDRVQAAAGISGNVMDKAIFLRQGDMGTQQTELDITPLVHFHAEARLFNRLGILVEGDGIYTDNGRFLDYQVALPYAVSPHVTARIGYRMMHTETGINGTDNSVLFHYGLFGASFNF
ncbi:hypothetical protein RCC89_08340 [Cytophagaceae bacterium ABcell3]|nr:hypothetical protein RCC89_08340 [Cytophagaceae bacterium ABcell3]